MLQYQTPKGYFNATEMAIEDASGLRPHHFIDNLKVQAQFDEIGKQPIVYRGRGACTFIPLELKYLFIAWLALNTKG